MEQEKMIQSIQEIFRDVLGDKSITISCATSADDIENWDSLNHIVILEAIQDEFHVHFELEEIIEMHNVGDIIDAINSRIVK